MSGRPSAAWAIPALGLVLAWGCGETESAEPPPSETTTPVPEPSPSPSVSGSPGPRSRDGAWFVDVAESSGLVFLHDAGLLPEKHLPETMGAGAALADVDGDGDLDAYLVQSGPMPVPGAAPDRRPGNALFLNDGHGTYTDASRASGDAAHDGYGMGVAAGDVDDDGDVDLFVTNLGPDVLLRNDGEARFTDTTGDAGVGDPRWTAGATFLDADIDGDLDLYVTAYVEVDLSDPLWCGRREPGWRSACHPDAYAGLPDRFYRNRGDGTFEDATTDAGLATPDAPGKGLGVIATDIDDDGLPDLYVANDSVENRLWVNTGGAFVDGTLLAGTGVNGRGLTEAGMGLAAGDIDGDHDNDLFVTNFDDESNTLYRNDGEGLFTDATVAAGLEAPSRLPVGFGTVAADLDNDGDLDLAVANGHIIDNIELYHDGKTHAQRGQLFLNDGAGHFSEDVVAAGDLGAPPTVGRGLYAGDVDADGDLDLLLTTCGGRARLLVNTHGTDAGASLAIEGLPPGTRLRATTRDGRRRDLTAGPAPSYFGASAPGIHLGLGPGGRLAARQLELSPPGSTTFLRLRLPARPETASERILIHLLPGGPQLIRSERLGTISDSATAPSSSPPARDAR